MIPVIVTDDEKAISIGEYKISALHFGGMAVYLANGGFMGWENDKKPEFAEPTFSTIKNSKRGLFEEISKKL